MASFSFVARANNEKNPLSSKNLEAACQQHLLRSEAQRKAAFRPQPKIGVHEYQSADAHALLWAQKLTRELSAHMNEEDSLALEGKVNSAAIALTKYENIFLTQTYHHEMVTQTALQSMLMGINGQADRTEVASILARHWRNIFRASFHYDPLLDTARLVTQFIVELGPHHVIPGLYSEYQRARAAPPSNFNKTAFIAHTEHIILRLGYKHELYKKLQNSSSFQAFQELRNRYGIISDKKKTIFYRQAYSFAGQLYGFFRYEAHRKSDLFDSGILELDPIAEKATELKDSIQISLKRLTAETDKLMGLSSQQKVPALIYADYLAQLSGTQALNLSPEDKQALLDSFHLDQIPPANLPIHFETLSKVYKRVLELSSIWERFLVELKKNEGSVFVPTHDDVLPLIRNVDPFIFELLTLTSASPEVVDFCQKALNF